MTRLGVHAVVAILTVALALALSRWLGERRAEDDDLGPFESGVPPIGAARLRVAAPYALVAAFFVVFDVEAGILFAWAVAAREAGVPGLVEAAVFVGVLLAGWAYLVLDQALRTGPTRGGRR
jgi:NADH-quinone oxidoreductase subunit A